jgi:glucose 1-dehydrogenase
MVWMTGLAGKVTLVTGASSGIGAAIALEFGRQAAKVVVNYVGPAEPAQVIVQQIPEAIAILADVSKAADVQSMVDQAVARFGRVDVLVNNAGIERYSPFLEKSEADWDAVLAVNLKGPFLCTQAVARDMVRRKERGTIINISSVHEDLPFPGYAEYCAAKGGLRMLCRDLALELAPYGINVVNVAPGAIVTPINTATLTDPAKTAALEREIPLHRIGTPEEVAQLVAYLASDAASYITATTMFIDGGLMHNTGGL